MIALLARASALRLARTPRAWLAPAAWSMLGLVVALAVRARGAVHGADHAVQGTFGSVVLPLLAFAVVGALLGAGGLGPSVRGLVSIGARPARAALATTLVAVVATSALGALLTAAVVAVAHGSSDPSLLRDVPASFVVGALGGAAYAAFFCAGASATRGGGMRAALLVADFLLGGEPGVLGLFTPRAHVLALLGAPPVLDLSRRASSVALVLLACAYVALATWLSRRAS